MSSDKNEAVKANSIKNSLVDYLNYFVISLISSLIVVSVYDRYFSVKIASLDVTGFVEKEEADFVKQFSDDLGNGKVKIEEFEKSYTSHFAELKSRVVKARDSVPDNYVVILGDTVLKNSKVIEP
ncbi:MAG: hypothetical protein OEY64_12080 [Nitrospinota bacterium]|nr:hypothetical protein [Nitrospinota bacterium]